MKILLLIGLAILLCFAIYILSDSVNCPIIDFNLTPFPFEATNGKGYCYPVRVFNAPSQEFGDFGFYKFDPIEK